MAAESDFDQARRRVDARRSILLAIAGLSSIERRQLLADLLLEAQEQQQDERHSQSLQQPSQNHAAADGKTFSDRAVALLASAGDGLTVAELGARLYPDKDPKKAKHNARSILRWLSMKGRAKDRHGRWFSVEAPASKKRPAATNGVPSHQKMTIPEIVVTILGQHPNGLKARELIGEIAKTRPDVDEKNVRSTVYRESTASDGRIARSGGRGDFTYFLKATVATSESAIGGRH